MGLTDIASSCDLVDLKLEGAGAANLARAKYDLGQVSVLRIDSISDGQAILSSTSTFDEQLLVIGIHCGQATIVHNGQAATLNSMELFCCDRDYPTSIVMEPHSNVSILAAPLKALYSCAPFARIKTNILIDGQRGFFPVFFEALNKLGNREQDKYFDDVAFRIGDCLLRLFATGYVEANSDNLCAISQGEARRVEIRDYVEQNLSDCDLSVETIARNFNISVRYIHLLFSPEGETIANFIRRRRLEEGLKLLSDPGATSAQICRIATHCGFKSPTAFARRFRKEFQLSPSEYRKQAMRERARP